MLIRICLESDIDIDNTIQMFVKFQLITLQIIYVKFFTVQYKSPGVFNLVFNLFCFNKNKTKTYDDLCSD